MTLDELRHKLNADIIQRVQDSSCEITLQQSTDTCWTSQVIRNNDGNINRSIIGYRASEYSQACFTHELLHVDTQIKGYKKPKYGISGYIQGQSFRTLLDALDNELQHHKMHKLFKFPAEQFYIDSDINTQNKLELFLKRPVKEFNETFLQYLTLIAPLGHINTIDKNLLKEEFRKINGRSYADFFVHLDNVFENWTNSTSYDISEPMKQIFFALPSGDMSFFGFGESSEFPNNGFFVDKEFQLQQPT